MIGSRGGRPGTGTLMKRWISPTAGSKYASAGRVGTSIGCFDAMTGRVWPVWPWSNAHGRSMEEPAPNVVTSSVPIRAGYDRNYLLTLLGFKATDDTKSTGPISCDCPGFTPDGP